MYIQSTSIKKCQPPSSTLQGASCTDIPPAKRVHHDIHKRLSTSTRRKKCQTSSTLQGARCIKVHHDIPQQLAGSSRQYESDDSDSTCIQQYESDSSQQSDGENSETDDDARQHSIASSSQTTSAGNQNQDFNEMYETLFEARAKWYNLGLALGIDTGTLDSIKHNNKGECEACLREALKQRQN